MSVALSYTSHGAAVGTPIVILHGLLGSSGNWRSIARHLAERHRVFALDLRNHGKSPHVESMSYPAMADDASGRLIGAGIVGPHAGDLISEANLALEMGADAADIALTIHPHPTFPLRRADRGR